MTTRAETEELAWARETVVKDALPDEIRARACRAIQRLSDFPAEIACAGDLLHLIEGERDRAA